MKTFKRILLVFLLATSVSTCCLGEKKEDVGAPEATELPEKANPEEFDIEGACLLFEAELARINAEIPGLEGQEKEDAIKRAEVLQGLIETIKDSNMHASELQENTTVWAENLSAVKKNFWIMAVIGGSTILLGLLISGVLVATAAGILKWAIQQKDKLHVVDVDNLNEFEIKSKTGRLADGFFIIKKENLDTNFDEEDILKLEKFDLDATE